MELEDLEVVATLGVGGFGRVELVKVNKRIFSLSVRNYDFRSVIENPVVSLL